MILTDYFRCNYDASWDIARQCGVHCGVIRLPEDGSFDLTDRSHWQTVYRRFQDHGITPMVIEPMPNEVHDHIKIGDAQRDECIDKVIKMFPIMRDLRIETICFNWMAHIGWFRSRTVTERGGATVTGFDVTEIPDSDAAISEQTLWDNYSYFLNAVLPEAEKFGIRLALHPDDPPLAKLGGVSRIMVSPQNITRAVREVYPSDNIGVTMCQATYYLMGEDLEQTITSLADKIMFVHFRNVEGVKTHFRETFHDNGDLDMPALIRLYHRLGVDVPIRVDHVPTLLGENTENQGYALLGRLFAIGYLKGILDSMERDQNDNNQ